MHCIMQINTLLNCTTTDNMDCVPSLHHPSDMGQVDTTLESSVERDICTWPVKKTSSDSILYT